MNLVNCHCNSRHCNSLGEILREEFLSPLEMSAKALAMRLRIPAPRINDVVRDAA